MRLHTNVSEETILRAGRTAGVTFPRLSRHGSRSRDHAFDVLLSGDGRRSNFGGDFQAATWDQWGIFLAEIFEADPEMKCWAYDGADEFHWMTGDRFHNLELSDTHIQHRWEYGPFVSECKCGAFRRAPMMRGK